MRLQIRDSNSRNGWLDDLGNFGWHVVSPRGRRAHSVRRHSVEAFVSPSSRATTLTAVGARKKNLTRTSTYTQRQRLPSRNGILIRAAISLSTAGPPVRSPIPSGGRRMGPGFQGKLGRRLIR